jgi:hypothetical protein
MSACKGGSTIRITGFMTGLLHPFHSQITLPDCVVSGGTEGGKQGPFVKDDIEKNAASF